MEVSEIYFVGYIFILIQLYTFGMRYVQKTLENENTVCASEGSFFCFLLWLFLSASVICK